MTQERTAQSPFVEWRCPDHSLPLADRDGELWCPEGERFPRLSGIPRFVDASSYADSFGRQWNRFRRTQLDSYLKLPISRDRARRCIGEELWERLDGLQVLECGCGAGRFTEVLLSRGCRVTSIDLSAAVEANQAQFPQDGRHRIAQADLLKLPFAGRQFDLVFCLGVVQHTPDSELAIARLYEQVRPGGTLVFDHYTYRLSRFTKLAALFRAVVSRLPPDAAMRATDRLVDVCLPLHRRARRFYPAQALLSRLSPVVCYYRTYPQLSDEVHEELARLDTHDSLTDRYKHLRTRRQIRRLLDELGLEDVWCEVGGNGVEARGRRPLAG